MTAPDILPHGSVTICPKCGDIHVRAMLRSDLVAAAMSNSAAEAVLRAIGGPPDHDSKYWALAHETEFLIRSCDCGFGWLEHCADHEEQSNASRAARDFACCPRHGYGLLVPAPPGSNDPTVSPGRRCNSVGCDYTWTPQRSTVNRDEWSDTTEAATDAARQAENEIAKDPYGCAHVEQLTAVWAASQTLLNATRELRAARRQTQAEGRTQEVGRDAPA